MIKIPPDELTMFRGVFGNRAAHALALSAAEEKHPKGTDLDDLKAEIVFGVYNGYFCSDNTAPNSKKNGHKVQTPIKE